MQAQTGAAREDWRRLPFFAKDSLLFEPGTRYRSSSYGWILVSAAVETAAGEAFIKVMRKQVFEPLGMNDTKSDIVTERIPNLATSYFPKFAADPRHGPDLMRPIDFSCYSGWCSRKEDRVQHASDALTHSP